MTPDTYEEQVTRAVLSEAQSREAALKYMEDWREAGDLRLPPEELLPEEVVYSVEE